MPASAYHGLLSAARPAASISYPFGMDAVYGRSSIDFETRRRTVMPLHFEARAYDSQHGHQEPRPV